jgi:N-acetylmuramoyl-L-alanine amidase
MIVLKKIKLSGNKWLLICYIALLCLGIARAHYNKSVNTASLPVEKKNIVIDAGHGGFDPGKVASDGIQEKGINLKISEKLKAYLEQGGAVVYMTRLDDTSLSDKKREDLKNRTVIGNGENVDLFVSVHQNSFPKNSAKGAQVFYYKKSENGKRLATCIQSRLKEVVDTENDRVAKPNKDYYILREITVPSVIVECGFLSNSVEHDLLQSDKYQSKLAWAIYMGILDYYGECKV